MDPLVWPIAEELLDCLKIAFEDDGQHLDPPGLICHRTGTGATVAQFDPAEGTNECCHGLAWVRATPFGPTLAGDTLEFNRSATMGVTNCGGAWSVGMEIGSLRCWPHAGSYPSCDDWATTAYNVLADAAALRRAVICCFAPNYEDTHALQVIVEPWRPAGIQGQCVGGTIPLTIGVNDRSRFDCCTPTSPTSPTSP